MDSLKRESQVGPESQEAECFRFSEETAKRADVQKLSALLHLGTPSGLELNLD